MMNDSKYIHPIKTCDFGAAAAIAAFVGLNMAEGKKLTVVTDSYPYVIVTDDDPAKMLFPAGWYFTKNSLRNKHRSTTGAYEEIPVRKTSRQSWTTYVVENARQCKGEDFSAPVCARVIAALNHGAKLIGPCHVAVKAGKPIDIVEGWTMVGGTDMGFKLVSGNKTVKVYLV